MRVAVHFRDGSVSAYKLGRIVDGQHTDDLLTGKTTSVRDIAEALAVQAEVEYPDEQIVIERWVDNGDGTSRWEPEDGEDHPDSETPALIDAPSFDLSQETLAESPTGENS